MNIAPTQFQLVRKIAASQERLWHLMTDPKSREAWSGPTDEDVLHTDAADLREDGCDVHRSGSADAPDFTVATRWYRLDGPTGACFTETVEAGGMRIATSLVTYRLTALEDALTQVTVDVSTTSFVGEEALADFKAGWTSALDRLPRIMDSLE